MIRISNFSGPLVLRWLHSSVPMPCCGDSNESDQWTSTILHRPYR